MTPRIATTTITAPETLTEAEYLSQLKRSTAALDALTTLIRAQFARLPELDIPQLRVAHALGCAQSTVSQRIKDARAALAQRPEGHPLWPAEAIALYDGGIWSREELLHYLADFPYEPRQPSEDPAYETISPGQFANITRAVGRGQLTRQDYADLYDLLHTDSQL